MTENFDDVTYGPITFERAKHHLKCLAVDCEWRATEIESFISAQEKLLADFARHLLNIQQDICENAFVEVSIYDAVKQALSEVAPDHSALRNEPPNYGVWEMQRKKIEELRLFLITSAREALQWRLWHEADMKVGGDDENPDDPNANIAWDLVGLARKDTDKLRIFDFIDFFDWEPLK